MIPRVVMSNGTLRTAGMCMALAGVLDGVIQLMHSEPFGFAAFACVLAVYYVHRARLAQQVSAASVDRYRSVLGRGFLLLAGVCVIEFCLIQIAAHAPWLSDYEWFGIVAAWIFIGTVCATALCLLAVLLVRLGFRPSPR